MTEKIQLTLRDSKAARWTALILIALMMFFAYMFVDVMSPLQTLIESKRSWTPDVFGTYAASEYFLNVCGFLILAGIILDKFGVRFTGTLSASLMVAGAVIKYIAVSDAFQGSGLDLWLSSWWTDLPGNAKLACLGFMVFGCGCEMAGITVSRAIARWFEGKEMALAMGLEMAIARLGVFAVLSLSPLLANKFDGSVVAPIAFCTALLLIGLINFIVFTFMDKKLDKQLGIDKNAASSEDQFKFSDIKYIFGSKMFWLIALLCVLYYSAIFPFQRYATNFLESALAIPSEEAANIFRWFPILAMILTPLLGSYIDYKGKGASMLMYGALIMIVCHLSYAFLLPAFPSKGFAFLITVVLGVSFSLVPAALWPSVPKVIEPKILGSAYALIFWIQNIGLWLFPLLIGKVLDSTNQDLVDKLKNNLITPEEAAVSYDYTAPLVMLACLGVAALVLGFVLKVVDKKKGLGLEEPNIKE